MNRGASFGQLFAAAVGRLDTESSRCAACNEAVDVSSPDVLAFTMTMSVDGHPDVTTRAVGAVCAACLVGLRREEGPLWPIGVAPASGPCARCGGLVGAGAGRVEFASSGGGLGRYSARWGYCARCNDELAKIVTALPDYSARAARARRRRGASRN